MFMKEKCQKRAKEMKMTDFRCSSGWINTTLKSSIIERIDLHGEVGYMYAE